MYCNSMHDWWSTQSCLATLLSSLIARRWVWLQTLWQFRLKDLPIDEMIGDWCFGCCQANWGLPVRFYCSGIQFYVLLSPYHCLISFFYILICSRRWCLDKFYVSWSTSELRVRLECREIGLSPPVTYFYWPFQGGTSFWIICVMYLLCLSCIRVC